MARYPEHLCTDDDARLKTVTFASSTPDHVLERAEAAALDGRAGREENPGQTPLTDGERDRIDFAESRANVPHARSLKAIATREGVDDWLAYYDPTLTVDEHRSVMADAAAEGGGCRLDSHEDRRLDRAGDAVRRQLSGECDHARGHCRMGDPEACEFLEESCGLSSEEIDALVTVDEESGHAQQAARAVDAIRREHGRDPLDFGELEERQARLVDPHRRAAADCHECGNNWRASPN